MILDACCGALKMYDGLVNDLFDSGEFITIDKRKGDFSYQRENDFCKHEIIVKPLVLADMRFLPFKDGSMDGIVCDPPHLKCGDKSYSFAYYGSWSQEDVLNNLRVVDPEFSRVLRDGGFLFLKIMNDRKEVYLGMLKHFSFFLPIQIKRRNGKFKDLKEYTDGAIWLIGYKLKQPKITKLLAQLRLEAPLENRN